MISIFNKDDILQEEKQESQVATVAEETATDKTETLCFSENLDLITKAPVEGEFVDMEAGASVSAVKKGNREKFDSGIGDEIIETHNTTSPDVSDGENRMEVESNSSSSSDEDVRAKKRQGELLDIVCGMKWRFVDSSSDNENTQEESPLVQNAIRTISSPYTIPMKKKIQELPLPSILKTYLNFYRE